MIPLSLLLKRIPGIWYAIAFAGVFLLASTAALIQHERGIGRDGEKTATLRQKLVHDVQIMEWHDTIVVHDTVRLTRFLTHYDTLRLTLNVHDTIQVRAFIMAADSTVRACRETVRDLGLSCAAKDSVIATQAALIQARALPLTKGATWKEKLTWALVGAAAGELAHRVRP